MIANFKFLIVIILRTLSSVNGFFGGIMKLNEIIRELRSESPYTQREVAEKLGITLRAYQHYETGSRQPTVSALIKLADIFGVSIDSLVGRSDSSESFD